MPTLPATLKTIPTTEWTLTTHTIKANSFWDESYYGDIKRHGKKVGEFEESREGGPTRLHFNNPTDFHDFRNFAITTLNAAGDKSPEPAEDVIHTLCIDHKLAKTFNAKARRGQYPFSTPDLIGAPSLEPIEWYYFKINTDPNREPHEHIRELLRNQRTNHPETWNERYAGHIIWIKDRWENVETLAA